MTHKKGCISWREEKKKIKEDKEEAGTWQVILLGTGVFLLEWSCFHISDTASSTLECSFASARSLYSDSYLWRCRHMKPNTIRGTAGEGEERMTERENGANGVKGRTKKWSGEQCKRMIRSLHPMLCVLYSHTDTRTHAHFTALTFSFQTCAAWGSSPLCVVPISVD